MKNDKAHISKGLNDNFLFHENDAWERALDFLLTENAYLKTRLSEAVDEAEDKSFLALAEQYQSIFLKNDEVFKRLLAEVKQQKVLLKKKKLTLNTTNDITFEKKQSSLRIEMEKQEIDFKKMKSDFNTYLSTSY